MAPSTDSLRALGADARLLVAALATTLMIAATLVVAPPVSWALLLALLVVAAVGADQVIHRRWRLEHLAADRRAGRYQHTLAILPTLVAAAAALFLRLPPFGEPLTAALGTLAAGLLYTAVTLSQAQSQRVDDAPRARARLATNLLAYVCGLMIYAAIYAPRTAGLLTGIGVGLATVPLAFELLRVTSAPHRATRGAWAIALILGEIAWALTFWPLDPLVGGALLLLLLYPLVGLAQSAMAERLTPRLAAEYGGIALVGAGALLAAGALR